MPHILLTGIATLDIINQLDHYPAENSETRALKQFIRNGGNAANSATVLQQLGINAHLLAKRADDSNARLVYSLLEERQIDTTLCPVQKQSKTPTSYITLNEQNGSRSIVHYRDLDELQATDFTKLDLFPYDWLHFEARDCTQLHQMLKYTKTFNKPISIELEKNRAYIDNIMPYADVLFISKPFARSRGFTNASDCLQHFAKSYNNKIITCTWGEQGAWAYANATIIHQNAFTLQNPVDTLGAGDTFNAGFIFSLVKKNMARQNNIKQALNFACRLAANKCQQNGFDQLIIPSSSIPENQTNFPD